LISIPGNRRSKQLRKIEYFSAKSGKTIGAILSIFKVVADHPASSAGKEIRVYGHA